MELDKVFVVICEQCFHFSSCDCLADRLKSEYWHVDFEQFEGYRTDKFTQRLGQIEPKYVTVVAGLDLVLDPDRNGALQIITVQRERVYACFKLWFFWDFVVRYNGWPARVAGLFHLLKIARNKWSDCFRNCFIDMNDFFRVKIIAALCRFRYRIRQCFYGV